ncbi:MAG TPA: amidohydrolase [Planctomycetaceae bacterium]|nr:amidohydrolase [Planctomycetaceae bacterium]
MSTRYFSACVMTGWLVGLPQTATAEQPADLVVLHGKVLTVDREFSRASAVAIRDGLFVAVGSNDDIRKFVGDDTRVLDAHGRTVIPGLIETHVHATGAARGEAAQPFVQLGSIGEIQDWLRQRAAETPRDQWIRLPRVDVTRIRERRLPSRADLDEAAPEHPAVFNWQYANRQVQVLNSAALRAAGITRDTQPPAGGKIHRDDDGESTGVLENPGALTSRFLPRPDVPESAFLDSLERLLRHYNQLGITSIFERNTGVDGYRSYEKLRDQDRLPVRVTATIGLSTDGTVEGTERAIRALPFHHGDGDDWVRVGPLKIGVDGGVLYGTAFLREPYGEDSFSLYGFADPQYRGDLRISPEKLTNIIRTGHKLGWQMSSHVTGDAGVDAVLDAVEAADRDAPIRERRYTLIHAYFANPETARRAAKLGVCVDTQPAWYYKDGDSLADALGAFRLERFIGLATWRAAGVKVAINSDHMQGFGPETSLNPYDPFLTMSVAVTRKTERGLLIGPDERVSRADALRMMTIDAAWLSFDEHRKGSIEVGKLGDLAILSDDLLTCEEDRIKDIQAVATLVGGRVVYEP